MHGMWPPTSNFRTTLPAVITVSPTEEIPWPFATSDHRSDSTLRLPAAAWFVARERRTSPAQKPLSPEVDGVPAHSNCSGHCASCASLGEQEDDATADGQTLRGAPGADPPLENLAVAAGERHRLNTGGHWPS